MGPVMKKKEMVKTVLNPSATTDENEDVGSNKASEY